MKRLLHSSKFWVVIINDVIVILMVYFVGKYGTPSLMEDVKVVIAALQVPVAMIIKAIADEDVAMKSAGVK